MDYLKVLNDDLGRGFTKSDLERLIGLPKNSLSGVLNGSKKLSRKSELKVAIWESFQKPNPLELKHKNRSEGLAELEMELVKLKVNHVGNPSGHRVDINELNTTKNNTPIATVVDKSAMIAQYEQELTTLPDKGLIANARRKWLMAKIEQLKYNK